MNTIRIIGRCFITSLLLVTSIAIADRPAMESRPASVPPPPEPANMPETVVEESAITVEQTTDDALEVQPGETLPVHVLDFPRRGMSMEKVQNELGRPLQISPAVGKPPITTWMYDDRNVYFEYSTVIHVVATR